MSCTIIIIIIIIHYAFHWLLAELFLNLCYLLRTLISVKFTNNEISTWVGLTYLILVTYFYFWCVHKIKSNITEVSSCGPKLQVPFAESRGAGTFCPFHSADAAHRTVLVFVCPKGRGWKSLQPSHFCSFLVWGLQRKLLLYTCKGNLKSLPLNKDIVAVGFAVTVWTLQD